jgi:hypothetical protein
MVGCSGAWVSAMQPPSNKSPAIAAAARMNQPPDDRQLLHANRG